MSPSASPSASPRSDRACVEAVQAVNQTFKRHHGVLAKLHGHDDAKAKSAKEDAKQALKQADELLKGIRKAAVKAIHESCGTKHDDDDQDEDEDEDSDQDEDDKDKDRTHGRAAVNIPFTGTPSQMAQQAATAMEIVMSALRTKLEALPTATPKATPTRTPKPSLRPSPKPSKSPHASSGHSKG